MEDCGTSYSGAQRMNDYWAGGLRRRRTYIEYAKGFVDKLNAYRWPRDDPDIDFDELVDAIDFLRSDRRARDAGRRRAAVPPGWQTATPIGHS